LFELNNIKIPDDIEYYLIEKESEIKRGEAPELVVALLRNTANKAGYEILHLNANDDQYRFVLASLAAAKKWNNATIAKSIKIEIAEWDVPSDFATFKAKKQRRAPRSKLVRHLQKQSERATFSENSQQRFSDDKTKLLTALEQYNYQEDDSEDFQITMMGGHSFAVALFDIVAKSFGNNYFVNDFDSQAYALGLYYKMLAPRIRKYSRNGGISIISVPNYVMFSLIGKLSNEELWSNYAAPYIKELLDSQKDQLQKIVSQFPLMPLLLEDDNLVDKAHELLSQVYKQVYKIDTRKESKLLYDAMIEDRVRYTRLLPDLHLSIYSQSPFSFLPLEILYVSTLIDLPLSEDLIALRDKLIKLPIETDEGIVALEKYLALNGY